jgi:hypothetical protein
MSKTLSESAAEILKASLASASKEPAQKLPAEEEDLGGATETDPAGDEVGKNAAAAVKEAPKPGQVSAEGDKKMNSVKSVDMAKPSVGSVEPNIGEETEVFEEEEDSEEDEKAIKEAYKNNMKKKHSKSMAEDVEALFNGESLSEEFKTKATTIFEAAVNSRVDAILEDMMTENDKILVEEIDTIKSELVEQVDEYLNYVVEQWMENNAVAIESGLRSELTEDFINGLKNLFAEHYIDLPEEKLAVAESLAEKIVELEEAATAREEQMVILSKNLNEAKKNESIRKICEGLTEVQVGKMKSLAESVEFTTEGEFNNKLAVIRENYFPATKVKSEVTAVRETIVSEETPEVETTGIMSQYVKAISKSLPK